jgi:hypothetical protein
MRKMHRNANDVAQAAVVAAIQTREVTPSPSRRGKVVRGGGRK